MDHTLELRSDILKSLPAKSKQKLAFLFAVTKAGAGIDIYRKSTTLTYEFEGKAEAYAVAGLIKEQTSGDVYFTQKGAGQRIYYVVQLKDEVANGFLALVGLSRFEGGEFIVDDGASRLASMASEEFFCFFKGFALMQGQLKFPDEEYSNYSFQIKTFDGNFAEALRFKMLDYGVDLKLGATKTGFVLQSRNSKEIEDMLAMCGANECVFKLNNIIAEREQSNEFNRQSNLYMANYKKAVRDARKYIDAANLLIQKGALQKQDRKLQSVAKARIEYEDDSMSELAAKLSMSKTGLSRQLKRLLELAEEYDGRE